MVHGVWINRWIKGWMDKKDIYREREREQPKPGQQEAEREKERDRETERQRFFFVTLITLIFSSLSLFLIEYI